MEEAFRAAIVATGAVGERVYPVKLPQTFQRPAVTYQVISGPRRYTQDGKAQPTTFRVQIDIWGDTYEAVRTVRDIVVPALSGGRFEGLGSPAVTISRVFVDNERDIYESALDQAGPQLFRKTLDLLVTADAY